MAITRWSGNIGIWTLCLVVGSALSAFAQGQGVGAIGGIVADTSGAALPGCRRDAGEQPGHDRRQAGDGLR